MPYRYGVRSTAPFEERLARFVIPEPNSGCWLWIGATSSGGYGQFQESPNPKKKVSAHRASYEYFVGPIPPGMQIDHLCRVRCCVNPAHLEPVTNRENGLRGNSGLINRSKTHCRKGHPFEAWNLIPRFLRKGQRVCLTCERIRLGRKTLPCPTPEERGPMMEPPHLP